ncbi:MAG TPA: RNA polymerase sigma factor [Polyangiaceae bacterium]|jgi:RNA polymerase sigma-70 factor (ECF subfamily)
MSSAGSQRSWSRFWRGRSGKSGASGGAHKEGSGSVDTRQALDAEVRAALDGDRHARRRLVLRLGPWMLGVIRAVLGSAHPDVEDVLQESLLALFRALEAFRGECSVVHYGCRIALQRSLDARKHLRVVQGALDKLERQAHLEEPELADGAIAQQRSSLLLDLLLREIPQEQSQPLVMRYVLGYSIDEIAAEAAVSRNTVRSRLRLAKEALRSRIDQDERWRALGQRWRDLEEKAG